MVARDTLSSLAKVKALAAANPHVKQDISKWYDLWLEEVDEGIWSMRINSDEGTIFFTEGDLSINELFAAKGGTQNHPKGTGFAPVITIDTDKGSEPGPWASTVMSRAELKRQVEEAAARATAKYPYTPRPPRPLTLWEKAKKVVRMIRLRLRL